MICIHIFLFINIKNTKFFIIYLNINKKNITYESRNIHKPRGVQIF